MILTLSTTLWLLCSQATGKFQGAVFKLRRNEQALTSTEWALLVAGAAAIAIAVVAVVRGATTDAIDRVPTNVDVGTVITTSPRNYS